MDCSTLDDAEASEVAGLPEAVVPDAVGPDTEGAVLPLGSVANVLGETVGVGMIEGVFKIPAIGRGTEDPEAVEPLGLTGTGVVGNGVTDPEVFGTGGGELTETETEGRGDIDPEGVVTTRTGGKLNEDDPDVGVETETDGLPGGLEVDPELAETGLPDDEEGSEDDGPVGGGVEGIDEDELLVVTLTDPTVGLELEELPVGVLIEEDELFVLRLIGPTTIVGEGEVLAEDVLGLIMGGVVEETVVLELLGLGLGVGEDVGVVLEELEVVDPQPEIVVYTVAQKVSVPSSVQESEDPIQELLLAVTGGVVGVVVGVGVVLEELVVVVIPQPEIGVYIVEQKVSVPSSEQESVDPKHELVLTETGVDVVKTQPRLLTVVVMHS